MKRKPAFALSVVLSAVALMLPMTGSASGKAPRRLLAEAVEKEIVKLAEKVRREVTVGKSDALLALVAAEGIVCRDGVIPRSDVERDLKNPGSLVHATLFDSNALKSQHPNAGRARSWRDMFRANPGIAIVVNFVEFPGQDPHAFPCASFIGDDDNAPPGLCFAMQNGRWWLRESLYQCD